MAKDMYQKRRERKENKKQKINNNESLHKTLINWYPGHMAKAKREMKEKINLVDLVFEVIDARMPISSRVLDLDEVVEKKPRILVVTKYDLCDRVKTDLILDKYRELGMKIVPVDLMTGENVSKLVTSCLEEAKILNEKRKVKGMKPRNIRVLVVGAPNVGKSTLINRLVGRKAVQVGNRPGVTKQINWIRIHKEIELLDSPGILWPKLENQEHAFHLACFSSIREEILPLEEVAQFILRKIEKLYPGRLKERYGIKTLDLENNIEDTYRYIAEKRGTLQKGGLPDYDKVYHLILKDLQDGLLGRVTFDDESVF